MPGSTLTTVPIVAENSQATPGLWNNPFGIIERNVSQVNSDFSVSDASLVGWNKGSVTTFITTTSGISASGVTFSTLTLRNLLSVNTIQAASGNTIRLVNSQDWVARSYDSGGAVFNVRAFGAVGDGIVDDTNVFISVNSAASAVGGIIQISNGTYLLRPGTAGGTSEFEPGNNVTVWMADGAVLTHAAVSGTRHLINIVGSGIRIVGGRLIGNRANDTGVTIGVRVAGGSNVLLDRVRVRDFSLDGFYLAGSAASITLRDCVAFNNRRNGLSMVDASHVLVSGGLYANSNGTTPGDGIDIEPAPGDPGEICELIRVIGVGLSNNSGNGITVLQQRARDVVVQGCIAENNDGSGIRVGRSSRNAILGNSCFSNTLNGIGVDADTSGTTAGENAIVGNVCRGNGSRGIHLQKDTGSAVYYNTVSNNICVNNALYGIDLERARDNVVQGNVCSENLIGILLNTDETLRNVVIGNRCDLNDEEGIRLTAATNNSIVGNFLFANSQSSDSLSSNIFLSNASVNNIQANHCRRGSSLTQPDFGIDISNSGCTGNFVTNNDLFESGRNGGLNNAGTNTITAAGNRTP